jgi:branched-subunit amino acid permease
MDRFTKYALITIVAIVAVLVAMAYIGYQVGGNGATDDKVNDKAGGGTTYSPFTIEHFGEVGEYFGFCAAGCVGGFLVGYIFPTLFNSNTESRRKN